MRKQIKHAVMAYFDVVPSFSSVCLQILEAVPLTVVVYQFAATFLDFFLKITSIKASVNLIRTWLDQWIRGYGVFIVPLRAKTMEDTAGNTQIAMAHGRTSWTLS